MQAILFLIIVVLGIFLLDLYIFQALRVFMYESAPTTRSIVYSLYWMSAAFTLVLFFLYNFTDLKSSSQLFRQFALFWIFAHVVSKMFGSLFLLIDDSWRLLQWTGQKISVLKQNDVTIPTEVVSTEQLPAGKEELSGADSSKISRSVFLTTTALVATALPVVSMGFGILSGAHDYRVHHHILRLPKLPKSFDGIRIAQLSDIHSGSFFNKTAVKGGVEMLLREKPDLVFFTGDLVNNVAKEVKDYIDIFGKVTAPLGVYSTLGNHDYGDYTTWSSPAAKQQNMKDMYAAHKALGWNLMLNEHTLIKEGADSIAVLGVENYGGGRFPKYGKLQQAYQGTEDIPVKLLLSHDPSHWDLEVIPQYKDIDLTLSGHTHGMQFGIEIGNFKWSPVQYMYPQWAGLYQKNQQYLYVNRGYGYIGYPGRIGILPEITIIELQSV